MAENENYAGSRGNATTDGERGEHWQEADAARAKANDLLAQAADAVEAANEAEAKAISADEGVEHESVDASAGTWEGSVASGDSAPAEAVSSSSHVEEDDA